MRCTFYTEVYNALRGGRECMYTQNVAGTILKIMLQEAHCVKNNAVKQGHRKKILCRGYVL